MPTINRKKESQITKNSPAIFCDFSCKYADFGTPEVNCACRKELAIWCKKYKKYNNKHNKCLINT